MTDLHPPDTDKVLDKWYTPLHKIDDMTRIRIGEAMKEYHELQLEYEKELLVLKGREYIDSMLKALEMTKDTLNEVFEYKDGSLIYKIDRGCRRAGQSAGTESATRGFVVGFNDKQYRVKDVVWVMHNDVIPEGYEVVYIEPMFQDYRIENLSLRLKKR